MTESSKPNSATAVTASRRENARSSEGPSNRERSADTDSGVVDTDPDSPTDLSKPSLIATVKRAAKEFKNDNLTDLAAALTYYAVLAIFPGMIVLVSILGLLGHDVANQVVDNVGAIAPSSVSDLVRQIVTNAQGHKSSAGFGAVVGILLALWSASGYVAAFMRASNVIYDIGEGRPIWKTAPVRLGVTIVAVVLLVVAAFIVVASGPVASQLGNILGIGHTGVLIWNILKWPVLLVIVSVLLAILFWAAPNAKQAGVKWVSPGGVVAVIMWIVISALFAVYVTFSASYSKTYGALAGVIIFLVWLWLTNIAILLGAEVNAELEHTKAIAEGLPEDVSPFAEPRDTRKLDDEDKRRVAEAQAQRRS